VSVTAPDNRARTFTAKNGRITLSGTLNDNKMRFESQVQVRTVGGTRTDNANGTVTVSGADEVVLVLPAGTDYAPTYPSYRGADPHAAVTRRVDNAAAKPYQDLRARHVADYRKLFDRVSLNIGQQMPDQPTDDVLTAYRAGTLTASLRRDVSISGRTGRSRQGYWGVSCLSLPGACFF